MNLIDKFSITVYNYFGGDSMSVADKVKAVMVLSGKKQLELAEHYGMSRQSMNNKFAQSRFSADDLIRIADFTGCRVGFVLPDGQQILLETEDVRSD